MGFKNYFFAVEESASLEEVEIVSYLAVFKDKKNFENWLNSQKTNCGLTRRRVSIVGIRSILGKKNLKMMEEASNSEFPMYIPIFQNSEDEEDEC